jgi:phage terminase large subunit GpA-like protein
MTQTLGPFAGLNAALKQSIRPAARLVVSEWLDSHRVIGRNYPSAFPGAWRTERTPYLREPLNAFDDAGVEVLVLLFSSQIGKTECQLGTLLYAYGADPGPGMFVMPTVSMAEDLSKNRLVQALQTCAVLEIGSQKGRTSDSSILAKRINDAPLALAGAESPATLASRPIRYLWADEIDKWPSSTAEGDPLSQAMQRTAAFRRRKIVLTSTPTVKGGSRIEDWYERSDRQVFEAPCPRCGRPFVVEWHHVRWTSGEPNTAHLEHLEELTDVELARGARPGCGGRIEDHERAGMFAKAKWRATAPFTGIRGYRTWAVVSPWVRLSEMVAAFLQAKKNPETLQSWVNLTRAESWEAPSEKVESASLLLRREQYAADVPAGGLVLTAGVDTQDDRLEAVAVAWGPGEEAWILEHDVFFGDPAHLQVWEELDKFLTRGFTLEGGGEARVQCALVDALGHRTNEVYRAVVARQHRRVYASIGKDGGVAGQLVSSLKVLETKQGNVMRYVVDASQVKALIYSRLKSEEQHGPGVIHFPMTVGDAFFTSLTAEHLVTQRNKFNVPSKRWALRPGHTRNEVLDCFGMATAALRVICPTPARFADLAAKLGTTPVPDKGRAAVPVRRRTSHWTPPG